MTAPFSDKQRSNILIVDISPCVIPVIIKESLSSKILIKPCLIVNRRTVVMRWIYYLAVSAFRSEINRIILNASEIAAPPCAVPRWNISGSLPNIRSIISIALFRFRILLNTLNKNKSIWIYVKYGISAFRRCKRPVIQILWIVPLGNICRTCGTVISAFSMRLIF